MSSFQEGKDCLGWAARDASGVLSHMRLLESCKKLAPMSTGSKSVTPLELEHILIHAEIVMNVMED
ncbi:unnamed protein product [Dovyalis caffra]|uniref:Uncharacterized protein n=1 Tax=Dovyalis caffra TaxID=77055 RepID=A0AAV1RJJ7_9ROSI|nr:unnamed protein product [Dovyalis caffra]